MRLQFPCNSEGPQTVLGTKYDVYSVLLHALKVGLGVGGGSTGEGATQERGAIR